MSTIFNGMEREKEKLCIEDYTIAQPTLEQVIGTLSTSYDKYLIVLLWYFTVGVHPHDSETHSRAAEIEQQSHGGHQPGGGRRRSAGRRGGARGEQMWLHGFLYSHFHWHYGWFVYLILDYWHLRFRPVQSGRLFDLHIAGFHLCHLFDRGLLLVVLRLLSHSEGS